MTNIIRLSIVLLVLAILYLIAAYYSEQLKEDHLLTTGVVIDYSRGCGGRSTHGQQIYYQFYVNGISFKNSQKKQELPCGIGRFLVGKSFPVVYRKFWFGDLSTYLITPRDFEAYGYSFPDSLKWILPYVHDE